MTQLSFFEARTYPVARASDAPGRPIVRATDPVSSHEAAELITKSGKRQEQALAVLELVRKYPLSTSLELAQKSKLDRYQIARRLSELEEKHLVNRRAVRYCTVAMTRRACTWEAK